MTDEHPLAPLAGTWTGRGHGDYPTIEPFDYLEIVDLATVPDRPFLRYGQRTRHADEERALHAESGWLRPAQPGHAELLIAQPTGIVEVYEGSWDGHLLDLRATTVGRTATAKRVDAVRRTFALDGDVLIYDLWMAHADTPETHHLHAELHRSDPDANLNNEPTAEQDAPWPTR